LVATRLRTRESRRLPLRLASRSVSESSHTASPWDSLLVGTATNGQLVATTARVPSRTQHTCREQLSAGTAVAVVAAVKAAVSAPNRFRHPSCLATRLAGTERRLVTKSTSAYTHWAPFCIIPLGSRPPFFPLRPRHHVIHILLSTSFSWRARASFEPSAVASNGFSLSLVLTFLSHGGRNYFQTEPARIFASRYQPEAFPRIVGEKLGSEPLFLFSLLACLLA